MMEWTNLMYEIYFAIVSATIVLISAIVFVRMKKRGQADISNKLNLFVCTALAVVCAILTPILAKTMVNSLYFSIAGSVALSLVILIALASCVFMLIQKKILMKFVSEKQNQAEAQGSEEILPDTPIEEQAEIPAEQEDTRSIEEIFREDSEIPENVEILAQKDFETEAISQEKLHSQTEEQTHEDVDTESSDLEIPVLSDTYSETLIDSSAFVEVAASEEIPDVPAEISGQEDESTFEFETEPEEGSGDRTSPIFVSVEAGPTGDTLQAATTEVIDLESYLTESGLTVESEPAPEVGTTSESGHISDSEQITYPEEVSDSELEIEFEHAVDIDETVAPVESEGSELHESAGIEELIEKVAEYKYENNYAGAILMCEKAISRIEDGSLLELLAVELCSLYKLSNQSSKAREFLESGKIMLNPAIKEEILQNL